jgi:uncharacterized membrane protein (DUF2068 family)
VCSPRCAEQIALMESTLETIRQKTIAGTKLAAYLLLAAGCVFGCFGIYEIFSAFSTGRWAMGIFLPCLAVVFIVSGITMLRMLKKKI